LRNHRELDRIKLLERQVTMMRKTNYSSKFKADRVIEVLNGEETLGEIASRHSINPNLLRKWKRDFLEKAPLLFDESNQNRILAAKEREMESEREELLKTVGQLTIERDWLKKKSIEVFGSDYEKRFSRR